MSEAQMQMLLALAMLITTLVAGFAPLKVLSSVKRSSKKALSRNQMARTLSLLSCFAGGIFLATCFLDVIPHVNANFAAFNENSLLKTAYPLPELLFCAGFFLVYLIEEVCVLFFANGPQVHAHHHESPSNEAHLVVGTQGEPKMDEISEAKQLSETIDAITTGQLRKMSSIAESLNYTQPGALQSITFAIAMSFHSVLEGLALGVQDTKTAMMTLFVSLMLHKGIEAFSVGLQISKNNTQRLKVAAITIFIYSLMTPLGSLIGIYIQSSDMNIVLKEGLITVLEALAVGTFIYVTFFEVLANEKANKFSNITQLFAIIIGFSIIAIFQLVEMLVVGDASH